MLFTVSGIVYSVAPWFCGKNTRVSPFFEKRIPSTLLKAAMFSSTINFSRELLTQKGVVDVSIVSTLAGIETETQFFA